mmetsp:Transcript_17072/g.48804  ORF Transcript_17072/g.48804 Transcript_17072/m.48804 type:complete len:337 (-) Transcript_17072:27-1037(-)
MSSLLGGRLTAPSPAEAASHLRSSLAEVALDMGPLRSSQSRTTAPGRSSPFSARWPSVAAIGCSSQSKPSICGARARGTSSMQAPTTACGSAEATAAHSLRSGSPRSDHARRCISNRAASPARRLGNALHAFSPASAGASKAASAFLRTASSSPAAASAVPSIPKLAAVCSKVIASSFLAFAVEPEEDEDGRSRSSAWSIAASASAASPASSSSGGRTGGLAGGALGSEACSSAARSCKSAGSSRAARLQLPPAPDAFGLMCGLSATKSGMVGSVMSEAPPSLRSPSSHSDGSSARPAARGPGRPSRASHSVAMAAARAAAPVRGPPARDRSGVGG